MPEPPPPSGRYAGTRKPKGRRQRSGLATREFLHKTESAARAALPAELASSVSSRLRFSLLQLHFGDPTVHYEVWVQRRQGAIEVGLHFEGPDGERNRALLDRLVARGEQLMDALGLRIEPEVWTETWTRLHETMPLHEPLDEAFASGLGARVSAWVQACQPLLAGSPSPSERRKGVKARALHPAKRR